METVALQRLEALVESKEFKEAIEVLIAEERGNMENFVRNGQDRDAYGSYKVIEKLGSLTMHLHRISRMVKKPDMRPVLHVDDRSEQVV